MQAVKEEKLKEEQDAVNSLLDWERGTLREVDPKYDCSDDSDDEKNIKKRKQAMEEAKAKEE